MLVKSTGALKRTAIYCRSPFHVTAFIESDVQFSRGEFRSVSTLLSDRVAAVLDCDRLQHGQEKRAKSAAVHHRPR